MRIYVYCACQPQACHGALIEGSTSASGPILEPTAALIGFPGLVQLARSRQKKSHGRQNGLHRKSRRKSVGDKHLPEIWLYQPPAFRPFYGSCQEKH